MPRMCSTRCRVAPWYTTSRSISRRRSGGSPTARARCSCSTTLDELRRVVARARALDDRPPASDLWPAIADQIGVSSGAHQVVSLAARRTRRRVAFTVPQLAAAAALLLLLGSGGAYLALHRPPLGAGSAIAQRGPAADVTAAPVGWVQKTSSRHDAAVAELESALEQGRASGRSEERRVGKEGGGRGGPVRGEKERGSVWRSRYGPRRVAT